MKVRTYIITAGSYSNYRIVGVVEGPATPALSTIKKRFDQEYGLTPRKDDMFASVKAEMDAASRLVREGYTQQHDIADGFVAWLFKHYPEFHLISTIQEFNVNV